MYHYSEAITNTSGDSLIGYYLRVINPVTQEVVPLYADSNGTPIASVSEVADMAVTDEFGNVSFYIDYGRYDLHIYGPDATTFLYRVRDIAMTTGEPGPPGEPGQPGPPGTTDATALVYPTDPSQQAIIRNKLGAASSVDVTNVSAQAAQAVVAAPLASTGASNLYLSPRPTMLPNAAMTAAIVSGAINITVVGDSIQEPAGMSYADSVSENLQRLFQAQFPWATANLTNLSIPGRSMSDLANAAYTAPGSFVLAAPAGTNTSYWPGGSTNGKTWRDHVRDSLPDMIVLALGENDGTDELPFSINYQTFYEYSQTWTKKPWFVLVSSLLPEGSEVDRQGKQAIADFMQFKAIEKGFGLIDANSWYRLLRDGKRRDLVPNIEEINFVGFSDSTKWVSTGPTIAGTVVSGSGRVERQILARDVDMVDFFTLSGSNAVWASNFRVRPGGTGGYAVQANFTDGFTRLYYRGSLVQVGAIPTKTAGQSVRIRVKAWGPLIQVWHDNALVLSYSSPQGLYAGVFDVGTAAGAGSHAQFRVSYAPEYQAAASYFSATYLLNDVLHHPTSEGALQTYIPATKEFVDEFAEMFSRPVIVTKGALTADTTFPTTGTQILSESEISFRLASARVVPLRIRFGYKNSNATAGTLTLQLDGQGIAAFFLEPTTGANNRQLAFTHDVQVPAGVHTVRLVYGAPQGATAEITSQGGGNDRQLSATITVA